MKQILAALALAGITLDPAATLLPDAFDAPAPESVAEASKSAPAPEAHVHQHETEAEEALYVCPMHPEVTSKEPGKCPKCGMTLVRKKP